MAHGDITSVLNGNLPSVNYLEDIFPKILADQNIIYFIKCISMYISYMRRQKWNIITIKKSEAIIKVFMIIIVCFRIDT